MNIKNNIILALTIIAITLVTACGNQHKAKEEHAGHNHTVAEHREDVPLTQTSALVSLKDDQLNAIYQHYVHLTNALIKGDLAEAKIAANAIELGAKILPNGSALSSLSAKISAAPSLDAQRILYADLSNEFIAKVKSSGLSAGEIYVEYCPMALNDKGASWLSNQKEIKNPYFGDSMMNCGEVKETLK
ncbi:DUF3347 domain-containing protein [Pedobacter sp. ASV28]|uniref:DUF3347 domain-containing protein n=1 Tax=Pedobacter sp. ASV28 TaxID=2795123 RepID=UPI0018EC1FE2|nr:DUF3347 domain-containing protein [Pedobacter sp. ASV28]